jgi:hypothetical protein
MPPHPEVSAARIAAVAALLGALVGAIGTGVSAAQIADSQINAENARVRTEFQRTQLQSLYTDLVVNLSALEDQEKRWEELFLQEKNGPLLPGEPVTLTPLGQKREPPKERRDEMQAEMLETKVKLSSTHSALELFASPELTKIASTIMSVHGRRLGVVLNYEYTKDGKRLMSIVSAEDDDDLDFTPPAELEKMPLSDLHGRLVEQARRDLDATWVKGE